MMKSSLPLQGPARFRQCSLILLVAALKLVLPLQRYQHLIWQAWARDSGARVRQGMEVSGGVCLVSPHKPPCLCLCLGFSEQCYLMR